MHVYDSWKQDWEKYVTSDLKKTTHPKDIVYQTGEGVDPGIGYGSNLSLVYILF